MARVWYCSNCGYEVHSRGRCHSCREKLVPSALPELATGPDDEEVAYRIDGWPGPDRGQLIVRLNDLGVPHRFEEEELIIDASDEERVDDLVALLGAGIDPGDGDATDDGDAGDPGDPDGDPLASGDTDPHGTGSPGSDADDDSAAAVRLLADAATRLRVDPTDMQADADVAQASANVFVVDSYGPFSEEEWSAIGRVTRRLLAALGAEEALDAEIRREAGALEKLLSPLGATPTAVGLGEAAAGSGGERTVYELSDWLPDQRASLGFMLEEEGIAYSWEGDELLVPSDHEDQVEAIFDRVGTTGPVDDDGGEGQYQAVAELFAACGRLAGDPTDPARRDAVVQWIEESDGPPLIGMDDVDWFRIRNRARSLAGAIAGDGDAQEIYEHANALHDLLRSVV